MGTKVQRESYFPGISQMRDLADDSKSYSCLVYCGDKTFTNGQYYNGHLPRAIVDAHSGHDKDLVKRTMLEHEAMFRNQLYELHRLYRIQRDLMDEIKTNEPPKSRIRAEASEDTRKWSIPGFQLGISVSTRPSTSVIENVNSPLSSVKGSSIMRGSPFPYRNGSTLRDVEMLESRPTKVRRKMFDFHLPADEYIDTEERKPLRDNSPGKGNPYNSSKNSFRQNNRQDDVSLSGSYSRVKTSMADLNETVLIEDAGIRGTEFDGKQKSRLEFSSEEIWQKFHRGSDNNADSTRLDFRNSGNGNQWLLHQNAISAQMHPHLNSSSALGKCSDSSAQSNGMFGDRWNCNNISASNQKLGSQRSFRNGYYHDISAGSKELLQHWTTPGSYGHLMNRGTADNLATEHLIKHGSAKFYHGSSCYLDSKAAKDVHLNVVGSSNDSSNKAATRRGIEVIDLERNDDSNCSSLSWLRAIPASQHKELDLDSLCSNDLVVHGSKPASHSTNEVPNSSTGCHQKILGFPIFQDAHVPKKEPSYLTSPSISIPHQSEVKVESKVNKLLFDMNMPSDEMGIATDKKDVKASNFRCEIDLNSCISEDEASLLPCVPDSKKKKFTGIDLEAPIVPEVEEEDAVRGEEGMAQAHEEDSSIKVAAEAIVAISSSTSQDRWHGSKGSLPEEMSAAPDPLHWFADIITTCGCDLEIRMKALWRVRDNDSSSFEEEFDYFESMTLKLVETKEEDYMPKPLLPEGLKLDETGTSCVAPARTQRGNARRGRQRRDFQRDILPGLGSLSRHEVTEDLQTFGEMMRATGLSWHARNSTRSGSGRGRRRSLTISPPLPPPVAVAAITLPCNPLIQKLNSVEAGLEDRSLRGWGKTTRRPRRQRCPAGNLPTIPVT